MNAFTVWSLFLVLLLRASNTKYILKFTELALNASLLEGIQSMGYEEATPIQAQSMPVILKGQDLMGIAQTGTGKTAAFVLPVLHQIAEHPEWSSVKALIVVPTRELAIQIDQAVEAYSYFTGASSMAIYGGGDGMDFYNEKSAIQQGVDIVIATPGRLLSHLNVGADFSHIRFLILDEADRMMDMGFQPDLMRIIKKVNSERQTLMFSATMPHKIKDFAQSLLKDPVTVNIALNKPAKGVKQSAFIVHDAQKMPILIDSLGNYVNESVIIFSSTKQNVQALYRALKNKLHGVGYISSDLEQDAREEMLLNYRSGKVNILVATDVMSRGIDIAGIRLVVNYDVPGDAEDYVHRVGRTARADKNGEAITFVGPSDQSKFHRIESLIGYPVEKAIVDEKYGPTPEYKAASGRGGQRQGGHPKKKFFRKKNNSQGPRKS
jgi:ATP-dependent RNA helicase RhlE